MGDSEQTHAGGAEPASHLVTWANEQDRWLRAIVGAVLHAKGPPAPARITELAELFLAEHRLRPGSVPEVPALAAAAAHGHNDGPLHLVSLLDVRGVNAIRPGGPITFNPHMNVLFGENGVGKTGYVRVLKRAAGARNAEDILPLLGGSGEKPSARIAFSMGGAEDAIDWTGDDNVAPLNRIDIFDSRFTHIHVDENLTFLHTPGELSFFPLVQQAIEQVRDQVEAEITRRDTYQRDFSDGVPASAPMRAEIAAVSAKTDIAGLERLATLTPEEEAERQRLANAVSSLQAADSDAGQRVTALDVALLTSIKEAVRCCEEFDVVEYHRRRAARAEALAAYHKASTDDFIDAEIVGKLTPEWNAFVEAGENLIRAHGHEPYPDHGGRCMYCGQILGEAALQLLRKYREYCNGRLRDVAEEAERNLTTVVVPMLAADMGGPTERVRERVAQETNAGRAEIWQALQALMEACVAHREAVRTGQMVDSAPFRTTHRDAIASLEREAAAASDLAGKLKLDAAGRAAELARCKSALEALDSRRAFSTLLPAVRAAAAEARWVEDARKAGQKFSRVLRGLTAKAKQASEIVLNQGFERRFAEECRNLRTPSVKLAFPGRQGKVARRKMISDRYALSQVLSEGEQKVIALADFLAEAHLKEPAAPVVFDDPVNSLDYKRLAYVASRLAELSRHRQVIVFTHNIWFAMELLARFEDAKDRCSYFDVEADGASKGIVTQGTHPRADTYKSNKKRINDIIQDAGKLTGESRQMLVEKGYECLRNICEVLVESELLQGVCRRYEPNIRMTVLNHIQFDRLKEACAVVTEIFEKSCRYIASHSQPLETLNVRPTLDELKEDWARLQAARDKYAA